MRIRDAVIDDLPSLLDIYNYAIRTSAATFDLAEQTLAERREWFTHYGDKYPLTVADIDGHVVGYCSLSRHREKAAYAKTVESSIYIHPDYQGHGIGKALMVDMLARAKALGHHVIIAGITDGNAASRKLHERLGFTYVGCFKEVGFKFEQWQDVHYYQYMVE
ncbi:GNAT family N-acetyltransferase [Alicyclobacillus suci]|uniref:GNAT family N-acetyltransferase n=1 Tax=Alicyclobacillus suci TaxID=2816080 RepID=UPI001A8D5775|nr:GNAT family N-acetyltransferase [Alicyclobacillus suci]